MKGARKITRIGGEEGGDYWTREISFLAHINLSKDVSLTVDGINSMSRPYGTIRRAAQLFVIKSLCSLPRRIHIHEQKEEEGFSGVCARLSSITSGKTCLPPL